MSIVFATNDYRPEWPDHCGAAPQAERLRVPSSQRRRSARGMSYVLSHTRRSTRRPWRASASISRENLPFREGLVDFNSKNSVSPGPETAPNAPQSAPMIRGESGLCFCYYSSKRCDPHFLTPPFASSRAMASAPPSSLSPSVFRSSTPSGCPHEKMAAEAPIELGEARPTVTSREGGEQHLESDLYKSDELSCSRGATSEGKGSMSSRPGSPRLEHRLLEATFSAPSPGATAAACVTDEHLAAVRNVIYGVRAPCPCPALVCP